MIKFQISNVLINAQDEDLLVTEFSIAGQTSSGGTSTISDSSSLMSTNGIESRSSTDNASTASTENGKLSPTYIDNLIENTLSFDSLMILHMKFPLNQANFLSEIQRPILLLLSTR